jgi:hypothetical protein
MKPIMPSPIILSALIPDQDWDAGLVSFDSFHPHQALLGWEAQLKNFGAIMARLKIPCFITPAPELFFTPTSWAVLAQALGLPADYFNQATHIRFGTGRHMRILRGVNNYLASAEHTRNTIMAVGAHPLRDQATAPHALVGLLPLTDEVGPLHRPDASPIPALPLPSGLLSFDLPGEGKPALGALTPADFAGLELTSLAETTIWPLRTGGTPSVHIRRLALEFNAAQAAHKPFLLLPWNLANPATCVPDLVTKFIRTLGNAANLLLLPFNATRPSAQGLIPALGLIRTQIGEADEAALGQLFIGSITDLGVLKTLRRLNIAAWVDGLDPEAGWTASRLRACMIPTLIMNEELTEPTMTACNDEFGRRYVPGRTIAVRACQALAGRTGTVEGAMPFNTRKWQSWVAKLQG